MIGSSRHTALTFILLIISVGLMHSARAEDIRYEQVIEDLPFGEALYDFYQDNNLAAITTIETAKLKNRLINRPQDAELLLGGLYFEYGLEQDAEFIFNQLLEKQLDKVSQNRVWFSLAKLHYAKNNLQQCEQLLSNIDQKLSPQREAQKLYMQTNLFLQKGDLENAQLSAKEIPSTNIWFAYSHYNVGVSLLKAKNFDLAEQWLNELVELEFDDSEFYALQDAANLVLGMHSIKRQQPEQAIRYFTQIQLSSNLSNKALLGTGWAWSHQDNPRKAIAYWQALQRREQTDIASQEVLLAIAQGIEQMNNKPLAVQFYEDASNRYDQIYQEMNDAISGIQKGVLMNTLSSKLVVQDSSFDILDETLSEIPATPYLQPLFASENFQLALGRYQELLTIQSTLDEWQKNLPALSLMLRERQKLFDKKRSIVEKSTSFDNLTELQQKRDVLNARVKRIDQNQDYLTLANEDELELLERLKTVKSIIDQHGKSPVLSDQKFKYRILNGLLHWQLSTEFPRRLYVIKNELRQLNQALDQVSLAVQSLRNAAKRDEHNLEQFIQRISGQDKIIQTLKSKVRSVIELQQQQINEMAIQSIEARKEKLSQFRLKARYSLALLQDELSRKE